MNFIRLQDTFINPDSILWFAPEVMADGPGARPQIVGVRVEFAGGVNLMIEGLGAWEAFSGWAQQGGNHTNRLGVGRAAGRVPGRRHGHDPGDWLGGAGGVKPT